MCVFQRIKLEDLSRDECREVLLKRGFYMKSNEEDKVPEEYQEGPYNAREQKEEL